MTTTRRGCLSVPKRVLDVEDRPGAHFRHRRRTDDPLITVDQATNGTKRFPEGIRVSGYQGIKDCAVLQDGLAGKHGVDACDANHAVRLQ